MPLHATAACKVPLLTNLRFTDLPSQKEIGVLSDVVTKALEVLIWLAIQHRPKVTLVLVIFLMPVQLVYRSGAKY
jgi:hypothetical protein